MLNGQSKGPLGEVMNIKEFNNFYILQDETDNLPEAINYCNEKWQERLKKDNTVDEAPVVIWQAEGYEIIIPEEIYEVAIFDSDTININKLYISSSVNIFRIKSVLEKEAGQIFVEVDANNKRFSSYNGSVYSKDFKDLYYLCTSVPEVKLHEDCIDFWSGSRVDISYLHLLKNNKNFKSIGSETFLIKKKEPIILPENLTVLYFDAFVTLHFLTVKIPKNTRIIEKNIVHYDVDEENPYFSSDDGILYTKNFEKFLQGYKINGIEIHPACKEIELSNCKCDVMRIAENVELVTGYNACKNRYLVHKNNKYFAEYNGSLYSKDYSFLVDYFEAEENFIEIHPDCKEIRKGAIRAKFKEKFKCASVLAPECILSDFELKDYIKDIV